MTMIPVQHRLRVPNAAQKELLRQFSRKMRVSMPAIVTAFDADKQTVSVQPAIKERVRQNAVITDVTLPELDDVPVVFPTAGGWSLTFPIQAGDECDIIFGDMAFDHWFESGGVQQQPDGMLYRHDIGDAKAHFGLRSLPRALAEYSTSSMQLRNDDGSVVIDLAPGQITLTAALIKIAAAGGTPQALVSADWLTWFMTYVLPHITLPPGTPPPPATSLTTILEAQ